MDTHTPNQDLHSVCIFKAFGVKSAVGQTSEEQSRCLHRKWLKSAQITLREFLLQTFFVRIRISKPFFDLAEILYQKWYLRMQWECTGFIWLRSDSNDKQNAKVGSNELWIQHGADQLSNYELRGKAYALSSVTMSLEIGVDILSC